MCPHCLTIVEGMMITLETSRSILHFLVPYLEHDRSTDDCIASLLGSFTLESHLFAYQSTFDPATPGKVDCNCTTYLQTQWVTSWVIWASIRRMKFRRIPYFIIPVDVLAELLKTVKGKDDDLTFCGSSNGGE